ncbi:MAG: glycosyl hydrolase [Gammaproteobacteria bacterium]|nr:glycosyl hydrolase [Gammaproteobacteria bacterium]
MHAFGHPGSPPTWTSSAKDLVSCSLGPSRLWFTSGFGIVNEVYHPRIDIPQIRDLGVIVADDRGFWVELKRHNQYRTGELAAHGIPALEVVHEHPRFELRLRAVPDPIRDALLLEIALQGDSGLRAYILLAPHLGGSGFDNRAAVARHCGRKVLWADQGPFALALAAVGPDQTDAWGHTSAGYVGASDGWQDFAQNGALHWQFDTAGPGNVALVGALPRESTLALAFGSSRESAATVAFSALSQPFEDVWRAHIDSWRAWHKGLTLPQGLPESVDRTLSVSAMVLRVHQDKTYPGAMVASLSIPWGNARNEIGGYHLVWPRDLVESAGGLLALGAVGEARDILRYLIATQREGGDWPQNQWLGGTAYWSGHQLDETAFPVLLAASLAERDALDGIRVEHFVRRALGFIARNGPSSEQDRWEEDAGTNAFTLAVCIAALVCGAELIDEPARSLARRLADWWSTCIERWTSVRDTALARKEGVDGYFVRVAPLPVEGVAQSMGTVLAIKNQARDPGLPASDQVGTDFLELVRLGLRSADDPLVVNTLRLVDRTLAVDTPSGRSYHRYTCDGYGEDEDGRPFRGAGRGRAWPLLSGERGHYELLAGRDPLPYLEAMAAMAGRGGLIPEQVWDAEPLPQRGLHPGKPTGSAMPLVWAHAEFIKLAVSRQLGRPHDRPEAVWTRYGGKVCRVREAFWSEQAPFGELQVGIRLSICLPGPGYVHWGLDSWQRIRDTPTQDCGLGLHIAKLPTEELVTGRLVQFTYYRSDTGCWRNHDFLVRIV